MSSYVFSNEGEQGTRRLTALEKICDPISQRHLDAIGIQPGWRCLEIGAGTGSMATYLAKLVRQRGSVLATDIDTRFLNGLEESTLGNIEVRQHDIMGDPLPERAFDIIHARHVFVHLPRPKEYLARLMRAAKPGGWLFIEDFDPVVDRAIPILDQVEAQAFRSAIKCPYIAFERRGSEPDWGRKLANTFQHLGLTDIEVQAHLELVKGGSLFAEFYKLSLARIRHESVVAGWAKDSDFATTLALLDRPEFMCFSSVMFSAMPNGSTLTEWELSKCPLLRRFQGISGSGGDVVRSMFMTQFGSSVR